MSFVSKRGKSAKLYPRAFEASKTLRKATSDKAISYISMMPTKIKHLTELISQFRDSKDDVLKDCIIPTPSSGPGKNDAILMTNKKLSEMVKIVISESRELIEIYECWRMWIQMHTMPIEDGQGFGHDVQTEVMTDIASAIDNASALSLSSTVFHSDRAKMVEKICKYPKIENFAEALRVADEMEWRDMSNAIITMRDDACHLLDLVQKNRRHLENPFGSSHHLHHSMF
ncbi:putative proteasome activator p28 [Monocercomonoides exilis]|uniref:putative proteasome activator p28 n=1 Tax=Monocercomonoides exilis TaxID=2049356 RepID=UPI0035598408|nr:putative proteasome activator p28 [Monocercomonoides exilis]|eukprot:MONOS_13134.1-p1 / transcript=MONOS_13134.1 / gene=MONOS_13134 / organism=Monocercomonoides_exilis_PA203 / gene_product=proteasome activator p28 / transcript_product=proteasome activator p28 / location=Mono_scaffold00781:27842-28745(+) / protein_length=229 / sequence_SO=supercontig / SO=protein_coding / is_pseudo=false